MRACVLVLVLVLGACATVTNVEVRRVVCDQQRACDGKAKD